MRISLSNRIGDTPLQAMMGAGTPVLYVSLSGSGTGSGASPNNAMSITTFSSYTVLPNYTVKFNQGDVYPS